MTSVPAHPSPTPLGLATLDALPRALQLPRFNRSALSPGIVHFGPGNFHRAHQATYLGDLMNLGESLDWGIVGASVMPSDKPLRQKLLAQDCLSVVVAESMQQQQASVPGVMLDYLPVAAADDILAQLVDPAIRIVSLTVTEGGYFLDAAGNFAIDAAPIQADIHSMKAPCTVFGLIVSALARRHALGTAPFSVMSCDNLPHNGSITRAVVVGMAEAINRDLADWIASNVSFPNGMVDRITPATGVHEIGRVAEELLLADQAPVFCEDFRQWVLEDDFCAGRPELERVGVEFVDDVSAHERMKIRILNGGHALIAYAAGLLDIEFAHDAMFDPLVSAFLRKVEIDEVLPLVPGVPGLTAERYLSIVCERFANAHIGDTIRRLCLDGYNRQPKFIVPSIRDALSNGSPFEGLALESALWCRYCQGETDSGRVIAPNDPQWTQLTALAKEAREQPQAWLTLETVYGDVANVPAFRDAFSTALQRLWQQGTRATLEQYCAGGL